MVMGAWSRAAGLARPLTLARAHVCTCHHLLMQTVTRCAAVLRDGQACDRTVIEGSEFCVHHDRLLAQHGADALKQGLPRRKQARSSWQPTIVTTSTDEPEASNPDPTGHKRRAVAPAAVRPRLARRRRRALRTFNGRCSMRRHRRRSRPGSSSSARIAATESGSKFPSPTSVPGLPRSSCYSARD